MKSIQIIAGTGILFILLAAMVRTAGRALIPFMLVFAVLLLYVVYTIAIGRETPYPRLATGVFEREDEAEIHLSKTDSCESCTDDLGDGVRTTMTKELVLFGAPLAVLNKSQTVFCDVCANPLDSEQWKDSIDRELAQELETEEET